MLKCFIAAFMGTFFAMAAYADNNVPTPPQEVPRYLIGGIANDMILLIDSLDPDNSIYVQENTTLENGCVVTKAGINCKKPAKKETPLLPSKETIDIATLLEIVVSLIQTERDFPTIGKLKTVTIDKVMYVFANKDQTKLIYASLNLKIKQQYLSNKINILVLDEMPMGQNKGE